MVFFLAQDKEDFISRSKGQRRYRIVADLDRRSIWIQFRKGTKAEWILSLADFWNAQIFVGK